MAVMFDRLGKNSLAIEEYKLALKADYDNSDIHLNLASSYIKNKEINKAVEELGIAINFDPEAVEPHAILGLIYSLQNKPDEANREFEIALQNASKLEPQNTEIYKSLGTVYLRQNKLKEAESVYRLILDLTPQDAEAHFYLGTIYHEQKKKQLAEKEVKEAIKIKSDYPEALNYLGYVYVEDNRNLGQAESMINKALEMEPDNGAYIDSLGWLYYKKGRLKEALVKIEKASKLLEDPVIFDHLGDIYYKMGDKNNAEVNWQKSLQLDPTQDLIKEKIHNLKIKNAAK